MGDAAVLLSHRVQVLDKVPLNHNVDRWTVLRPEDYDFVPGEAVQVAIDRDGMREESRPFSFTNLPELPFIEFIVKRYPQHDGVTEQLNDVRPGESLLIGEPFGAMRYEGPGTFIAGGAGLTPFIAIFRQLERDHQLGQQRLIFTNERPRDVYMRADLDRWFGDRVWYLAANDPADLTDQDIVDRGSISQQCLAFDSQHFYICEPPNMGPEIKAVLLDLGADPDRIVHEDWS